LRILSADSGAGGRLRRAGATKVNWAYALSGVLAVLLLLYLLVALIWAEDL
jgi:K+-transporting ATPase KdpF subunit